MSKLIHVWLAHVQLPQLPNFSWNWRIFARAQKSCPNISATVLIGQSRESSLLCSQFNSICSNSHDSTFEPLRIQDSRCTSDCNWTMKKSNCLWLPWRYLTRLSPARLKMGVVKERTCRSVISTWNLMKSDEIRALVDMFFHGVRTSSLCTSWQWSPTRAWAQGVSLVMFGFLCVFWGFKSSTTPTCARTHERKVRLLRVNALIVETKVNKTLPVPNCCKKREDFWWLLSTKSSTDSWRSFNHIERNNYYSSLHRDKITKSQELGNAELSGMYHIIHLCISWSYAATSVENSPVKRAVVLWQIMSWSQLSIKWKKYFLLCFCNNTSPTNLCTKDPFQPWNNIKQQTCIQQSTWIVIYAKRQNITTYHRNGWNSVSSVWRGWKQLSISVVWKGQLALSVLQHALLRKGDLTKFILMQVTVKVLSMPLWSPLNRLSGPETQSKTQKTCGRGKGSWHYMEIRTFEWQNKVDYHFWINTFE